MGSLLVNSPIVILQKKQSYVIDLSYSYLYLHDICPAESDIEFMISLFCCYMLCLVRDLVLDNFYMLQYLCVCSSIMSVHLKGGCSARDTRVSLTSVDMVSGLIKCCWMSPSPTICRDSRQVVTALYVP